MAAPWEAYGQQQPAQGPWSAFAQQAAPEPAPQQVAPDAEPADHGLSERQKLSPAGKALSPITSYPETYSRMNREARALTSEGYNQAKNAENIKDAALGAGKAALGALGYVSSPISAAYRSVVGQPVEDVTGIPREYTEFAAQLATPGIGLTGAAKAPPVKGVATTVAKTEAPTIAELKAAAKQGYNAPEVKALEVEAPAISNFSRSAQTALNQEGFDNMIAPKTFNILANMEKVPEGAFVTGQNIATIRKAFGRAAKSNDSEERAAAMFAMNHLDEFVPSISKADVRAGDPSAFADTYGTANANYAAAQRAKSVDKKITDAQIRADVSNSGMNAANLIRSRMAKIITDPKEQRGLTQAEIDQARKVAGGTRAQNATRMAGNVLGGGGGIGAYGVGYGGYAAAGLPGAALPIVGGVLKSFNNRMTLKQAEKLSEMVRSRAPLASSMRKFEERAGSFDGTPRAVAGLTIASRNLSNNLRGAGINISPQELLQAIQSPQNSNANEQ